MSAHLPTTYTPVPPDDLERAYAACEAMVREHYENFPVASRLLPKEMRPHVAAIYAFARTADDFADEARFAGQDRLELLNGWRDLLRQCDVSPEGHPVFLALGHTIRKYGLPMQPFEDLLTAFGMDVTTRSYATFNDLLGYCRFSANPVGRLILLLFGHRDVHLHAMSDAICTGLQLANFWQDLAIDLDKGRCYIPREDLLYFEVTEDDLRARRVTPRFEALMRFEIDRTRKLFDRGSALPSLLGGRLRFEIRLVVEGGRRILDKIESVGCDVFARRPRLTTADWGRLLLLTAAPRRAPAEGP